MNFYVLTEEQFNLIRGQLVCIHQTLEERDKNDYFDNEGLIKYLKISARTLATWRESGIIEFSKIGAKFYYSRDDINNLMVKHHIGAPKL